MTKNDKLQVYEVKHNGLMLKVLASSQNEATAVDKNIIFVSYKKQDNAELSNKLNINVRDSIVEKILRSGDCAVWVDNGIIGATDWLENIERALSLCSMMVLIVTENIFDPDGFIALVEIPTVKRRRDVNNHRLPIYPVIVDQKLANDKGITFERVNAMTESNEQGSVLLFDGNTDDEHEFERAIKNILGLIPDSGIEGKIQNLRMLIHDKQFDQAQKLNDELLLMASDRYEPYWFLCQIMTQNFTKIMDKNGKADFALYKTAEKNYIKASSHASTSDAQYISRVWNNYVALFQNYCNSLNQLAVYEEQLRKEKEKLIEAKKEVNRIDFDGYEEKFRPLILFFELIFIFLILDGLTESRISIFNVLSFVPEALYHVFYFIFVCILVISCLFCFFHGFVQLNSKDKDIENSDSIGWHFIVLLLLASIYSVPDFFVNLCKLLFRRKRKIKYEQKSKHVENLDHIVVSIENEIAQLKKHLSSDKFN